MKTWLHRISHCADVSHPLLDRNYVSIGFSDFAYAGFLTEIADGGWEQFENAFDEQWGTHPKSRYDLWRFVMEMEAGDRLIVPGQGTFSIYEIISEHPISFGKTDLNNLRTWGGESVVLREDKLYRENGDGVDLSYVREVRPIEINISRLNCADAALTSRLKTRWTTGDISDLSDSVERAIDAHRNNRPINLHSKLLERQAASTLETLVAELNPDRFERLIKWYFVKVGASEAYIPSKNESGKAGDADVVATFEAIKTVIYVQAKFHQGHTSEWAAEQIKEYTIREGAMDDGYSRTAWVVSTGEGFSDRCLEVAKENHVRLFTGIEFATLLLEAGIGGLDKVI